MSQWGFVPDAEFLLEFNQKKAVSLEKGGGNPCRS